MIGAAHLGLEIHILGTIDRVLGGDPVCERGVMMKLLQDKQNEQDKEKKHMV
jgi:hypothetical protein